MSKLYRSRRDKKVTGLCGGLAEMLNVDATLLRLLVVITTFFSGGTVILIYFIASVVIPKEPGYDQPPGAPFGGFGGGQGFSFDCGDGRRHGYNDAQGSYNGQSYNAGYSAGPQAEQKKTNIDEVMKDIERKAMQREIEELKAKVADFEKKQKGDV